MCENDKYNGYFKLFATADEEEEKGELAKRRKDYKTMYWESRSGRKGSGVRGKGVRLLRGGKR